MNKLALLLNPLSNLRLRSFLLGSGCWNSGRSEMCSKAFASSSKIMILAVAKQSSSVCQTIRTKWMQVAAKAFDWNHSGRLRLGMSINYLRPWSLKVLRPYLSAIMTTWQVLESLENPSLCQRQLRVFHWHQYASSLYVKRTCVQIKLCVLWQSQHFSVAAGPSFCLSINMQAKLRIRGSQSSCMDVSCCSLHLPH